MTKRDYDLQLPEKLDFALISGLKYNFIFTKSRLRSRNIEIYRVLSSTDHLTHNTGYFRRRSKKISKLRVPGLCKGNSPMTGESPAQKASNAEKVSI